MTPGTELRSRNQNLVLGKYRSVRVPTEPKSHDPLSFFRVMIWQVQDLTLIHAVRCDQKAQLTRIKQA